MQETATKPYHLSSGLIKKARLLAIAGNQTRIRILYHMFENKKACVSEIAGVLGMTVSAISHHLQIMRDNGLFETERMGKIPFSFECLGQFPA